LHRRRRRCFWRRCAWLRRRCCRSCLTQPVEPRLSVSLSYPLLQAAQRGQKQSTAGDEDDPLASRYGDPELVQSQKQTGRVWTDVASLTPALAGQAVLVRARVHTVRGKGKSAFLVLRQATSTVQAVLFVDDETVSKGMVKYACAIPRESIVDVEATLVAPEAAIEACSQSQVGATAAGSWWWVGDGGTALSCCRHLCCLPDCLLTHPHPPLALPPPSLPTCRWSCT
jgi:hypothetical protein